MGTWQLENFTLIDDGGHESEPWLEGSTGILMYNEDGYMSAAISIIDDKSREPKHLSYCGPFEIGEDRVIHHVRISSNPQLVGHSQIRLVDFNRNTLTLSSSPSIYGGEKSKALLSWTRLDQLTEGSSSP